MIIELAFVRLLLEWTPDDVYRTEILFQTE